MIKRSVLFGILFTVIILQCFSMNVYAKGKANYHVYNKYYKRNSIFIEFPQIKGLRNQKKQKEINYILEHETFSYITHLFNSWYNLDNKSKVTNILQTISNTTDDNLELKCYSGFSNNHLLSIRYSVYGYCKGIAHPSTWGYTYTIDLDSLKVLKLIDILNIDKSILNCKGNVIFDRDTSSEDKYKLIDVLNNSRLYTNKEVIQNLLNDNASWYITKSKGISFFFLFRNDDLEFEINFRDIKKRIKTRYLKILTDKIK